MSENTQLAEREAEQYAIDVTRTENQAAQVFQTLQRALDEGKDVETVERLLTMQERIMDRAAEQEFWRAFHQARSEMPAIKARGFNQTTNSNFALLEDLKKAIEPIYSRHGFSIMMSSEVSPIEGYRRVSATIAHAAGHTEERHTDLPMDDVGMKGTRNKTPIHAAGSADTYGERYLLKLIWNLTIEKNPLDDDGNKASGEEVITDQQAADLETMIKDCGGDIDAFMEFYGIAKLESLPKAKFARAMRSLEKKLKEKSA